MKNFQWILTVTLALALGACGAIPSAYRGNYQGSNGALLKLGGTKGTMTKSNSEVLASKVRPLAYADLEKGLPGIYVQPNPTNPKLLDIFWLRPKLETKQSQAGITWYTTEIYYSLFDANQKAKLESVRLIYSNEGTVMLDGPTKTWQVGWPPSPRQVVFTRIKK
jgi:hypothetical protein